MIPSIGITPTFSPMSNGFFALEQAQAVNGRKEDHPDQSEKADARNYRVSSHVCMSRGNYAQRLSKNRLRLFFSIHDLYVGQRFAQARPDIFPVVDILIDGECPSVPAS